MSESPTARTTMDMVAMLHEREYTPEQISTQLSITLKRAKALVSEIERQKADAPSKATV